MLFQSAQHVTKQFAATKRDYYVQNVLKPPTPDVQTSTFKICSQELQPHGSVQTVHISTCHLQIQVTTQ